MADLLLTFGNEMFGVLWGTERFDEVGPYQLTVLEYDQRHFL